VGLGQRWLETPRSASPRQLGGPCKPEMPTAFAAFASRDVARETGDPGKALEASPPQPQPRQGFTSSRTGIEPEPRHTDSATGAGASRHDTMATADLAAAHSTDSSAAPSKPSGGRAGHAGAGRDAEPANPSSDREATNAAPHAAPPAQLRKPRENFSSRVLAHPAPSPPAAKGAALRKPEPVEGGRPGPRWGGASRALTAEAVPPLQEMLGRLGVVEAAEAITDEEAAPSLPLTLWRCVFKPRIAVRGAMSTSARALRSVYFGEVLEAYGEPVDGWLKLPHGGFALIRHETLGELLVPLAGTADPSAEQHYLDSYALFCACGKNGAAADVLREGLRAQPASLRLHELARQDGVTAGPAA